MKAVFAKSITSANEAKVNFDFNFEANKIYRVDGYASGKNVYIWVEDDATGLKLTEEFIISFKAVDDLNFNPILFIKK